MSKERSIVISIPAKNESTREDIVKKIAAHKREFGKQFSNLVSKPMHGPHSVGYTIFLGCDWNNECRRNPDGMNNLDFYLDKFIKLMQNRYRASVVIIDYGNGETRVADTTDKKVLFGTGMGTLLSKYNPHILPTNSRGQREVRTRRIEDHNKSGLKTEINDQRTKSGDREVDDKKKKAQPG